MDEDVWGAIRDVLGNTSIALQDMTWDHRQSEVFKIRAGNGDNYYAKRHGSKGAFERELHAYQTWTPALGDFAPKLTGVRSDLLLIVAKEIPGRPLQYSDPARRFEDAGQLLRRYHDAGTHKISDTVLAHPAHKLAQILTDASGRFTEYELRFVQRQTEELTALLKGDASKMVPCHLDFQPRNLLLDEAGVVRVIDFEYSKYDIWERDLIRIYWGCEYYGARCRDQFLEGYGHRLSDVEQAILEGLSSVWAVTTVLWAIRHGDRPYEAFGRFILNRVMQAKGVAKRVD